MTSSPPRATPAFTRLLLVAALAGSAPLAAIAAAPAASAQIEDLTWTELRERVASGARTALVPIGGTEQNGPHMVLGKHNLRVRWLATRIAERLGDALVAPVLPYVPEGRVAPPTEHMRWPGTISVPEPAFEAVLAGAARSLRAAGFCHVVLLGDHGGYRASLERAAATVNREPGRDKACGVIALGEYYRASAADFERALAAKGFGRDEIGPHAGLADTSLMLAIDPSAVRLEAVRREPRSAAADGVAGDPRRASADLGRPAVEHIIESSVAAIRARRAAFKP